MTAQLAFVETGPEPDPSRAQWFTPLDLARELVGLAGSTLDDAHRRGFTFRVLEPSAGRGHLVRAVLERCPHAEVDAIDVDPRWRADLEETGARVEIGDYLARPAPARRYDLSVSNPPYTGGEEVEHLEKLLDESERSLVLLPGRSLHGRERFDRLWSRFGREWWLRKLVHLVARPRFGRRTSEGEARIQASGGIDEIVLLDLRRVPGPCEVSWL